MDLVAIATVIGALATVGALLWAVWSSLDGRRTVNSARSLPSKPSPRMVHRKTQHVSWRRIDAAISHFGRSCGTTYDLVVGLQPDGVAMASSIASRLGARLGTIEKTYSEMRRLPFFVFEDSGEARSRRESTSAYLGPIDVPQTARVLVVDGVATFGNALLNAEVTVREAISGARVDFYVFAVDLTRLSSSHPELLNRTEYSVNLDNHKEWLLFPWDDQK